MNKLNDELAAIFASVVLPTDEEIRKETGYAKISQKLSNRPGRKKTQEEKDKIGKARKGHTFTDETLNKIREKALARPKPETSWNKGKSMSPESKAKMIKTKEEKPQEAWNKNTTMPDEVKLRMSLTKSKYRYATPKGIFETKREMLLAFPEYTTPQIERFTSQSLNGFSRTLKDQ